MEYYIKKDEKFKKVLPFIAVIYALAGIGISIYGFIIHSGYQGWLGLSTLTLILGLYLVRRCFHLNGGWQLEMYIYLFSFLGWTLGGAGEFYQIPYYDKVVHCLSGVFVSIIALAFYRMLERGHSREGENKLTGFFFVFFTSMAVAGMFELCEFALAPIMHRDLQHVLDTGVADTMEDMLVCLVGTLVMMLFMIRSLRGKHDPFTDAAEAFAYQNPRKEKTTV